MRIAYLIHTLYGIGGTIRTVINQADALAARGHDVEIVSVFRHREAPLLPVGPRVRVTPLVDLRDKEQSPLAEQPSRLYPAEENLYSEHSALSDRRIAEHLAHSAPDVVVGSRAALNILLARLRPQGAAVVGQEHLTYHMYTPALMAVMHEEYRRLDALVTVTEADARAYQQRMRLPGVRLAAIPNCVPEPALRPDGMPRRTILGAGRITGGKGYDLLIDAFARVADNHPGWTLRIYGKGRGSSARQRQITARGLEDRAFMMGPHPRIDEAWTLGAFCAVTSRGEAFGMTIVEAMRAGLPVLSTNCPYGPAEIIRDGEDGLLVESENVGAIAAGLDRMMGDDDLRARMAAAALRNSERFAPDAVARRHEELFRELTAPGSAACAGTPPASGGGAPAAGEGCRAAVGRDGTVKLDFAVPPDRVVLSCAAGEFGTVPGEERRIPVDGRGAAVIRPEDFAPGTTRWMVTRVDGGAESPVTDALIDLRGAPDSPRTAQRLRLVLPERDKDGRLSLLARRKNHYAEVQEVCVRAEGVAITGVVLGAAAADPEATLVCRLRSSPAVRRAVACPFGASGVFSAVLPVGLLPGADEEEAVWDLTLRSAGADHRVGRCLLGAADWKRVVSYPHTEHADGRGGLVRIRPYYTVYGYLAVRVTREQAGDPAEHPLARMVEEVAVEWIGDAQSLSVTGMIRAEAVSPGALGLRLRDGHGAAIPVAVRTERKPKGIAFEGRIAMAPTLDGGRPAFGRWRVRLALDGGRSSSEIDLHTAVPPRGRSWWRGIRPVCGRVIQAEQGPLVIECAPVSLKAALRWYLRRLRVPRFLRRRRSG